VQVRLWDKATLKPARPATIVPPRGTLMENYEVAPHGQQSECWAMDVMEVPFPAGWVAAEASRHPDRRRPSPPVACICADATVRLWDPRPPSENPAGEWCARKPLTKGKAKASLSQMADTRELAMPTGVTPTCLARFLPDAHHATWSASDGAHAHAPALVVGGADGSIRQWSLKWDGTHWDGGDRYQVLGTAHRCPYSCSHCNGSEVLTM
jgi:hypothetical protein